MKNRILQKLTIGIIAAVVVVPAGVFASGGSGGGGGTTSGGGGSTSGGTTTGGGGGGGGGTKVNCTTTLSVSGTATQALSGNSFTATYVLGSCGSKTKVSINVVDIATGYTMFSNPDLIGTTAVWTLPYTLTEYLVTARAFNGNTGATLATATTILNTTTPVPCTPSIVGSITVGYWGIYPAIWDGYNAQNCLIPGMTVHQRIINRASGQTVYDVNVPYMSQVIDYEGATVAYSTDYEFDVDLVDSSGNIVASDSQVVTSSPLR